MKIIRMNFQGLLSSRPPINRKTFVVCYNVFSGGVADISGHFWPFRLAIMAKSLLPQQFRLFWQTRGLQNPLVRMGAERQPAAGRGFAYGKKSSSLIFLGTYSSVMNLMPFLLRASSSSLYAFAFMFANSSFHSFFWNHS